MTERDQQRLVGHRMPFTVALLLAAVVGLGSSCAAPDSAESQPSVSEIADELSALMDTADLGPQPFDVAMESKFLLRVRDFLEGDWATLSREQLLATGAAYCRYRKNQEDRTAAADAVGLLVIEGVDIGFDSRGSLDDEASALAAAVAVAAFDSLCTWFHPNVTSLDWPGVFGDAAPQDIAGYVAAVGVESEYTNGKVAETRRSRVDSSAERLYLGSLESLSADSDYPVRLAGPEDEDRWLALGYIFCVVSDESGIGFGRTALRRTLDLPLEQTTLVSFVAAGYLCPEYLEVTLDQVN